MPWCARLLVGMLALMLTGCGTVLPPDSEARWLRSPLPRRVEWTQVPYFPQEEHQCGPAALSMVLRYAGAEVEYGRLKEEVYLPARQGSLQPEMLAGVRRHGMLAYRLQPDLETLLQEVAQGNPAVVLQNLGLDWYPVWHYAVVIGYDLDARQILLRSGSERRQSLSFTVFENTWERGGRWAMVVLPPGRLPATAQPGHLAQAAEALFAAGRPGEAYQVYRSAMSRWPDELVVLIGLSNAAYRLHDLIEAERILRHAVALHADSVAALNNLAQVLSDLGRDEEAMHYAARAVALGGPLQDIAQATRWAIEQKRADARAVR